MNNYNRLVTFETFKPEVINQKQRVEEYNFIYLKRNINFKLNLL